MSEDEQRVQVQIALWQMLEAEGMKPTADLVRRIRKLVEDGLKDRDVVLEEAAKDEDSATEILREMMACNGANGLYDARRYYKVKRRAWTLLDQTPREPYIKERV